MYVDKTDMELVGHVEAIPDASELSQHLANRVRLLVNENAELQRQLIKVKQQLMSLELGVALDKIAAYDDLVANGKTSMMDIVPYGRTLSCARYGTATA
jgi:HEAT repeat protein